MTNAQQPRVVNIGEEAKILAVSASNGHSIYKSSHALSGVKKFDIDPTGNVTLFSNFGPSYFMSQVFTGLNLEGVQRRERSVRRKLIEDVAPEDIQRGDRLFLKTVEGNHLTTSVVTGTLSVPLDQESRDRHVALGQEADRRSRLSLATTFGSIGGLAIEGITNAPRETLLPTVGLGIAAILYGMRQNGIALDHDARAHSPQTADQIVDGVIAKFTTDIY